MIFILKKADFLFLYRNAKWTLELSTRVENLAYEKSRGIKVNYLI